MPAPPLAHLGHWYVSLPVFMGPVLLVVIALKLHTWRERRSGPERSGQRSIVMVTHDQNRGGPTITVTGPLDYPAVLEIEGELGKLAHDAPEIVLDLRGVTTADEQAAWSLCDAVGRVHTHGHISAVIGSEPAMDALKTICEAEGIGLLDTVTGPNPSLDDAKVSERDRADSETQRRT
jgi:anti-anti-sigma regulatory factor